MRVVTKVMVSTALVAASVAVRRFRRGVVQATGAIVVNRVEVISVHYCHQVGPAIVLQKMRCPIE